MEGWCTNISECQARLFGAGADYGYTDRSKRDPDRARAIRMPSLGADTRPRPYKLSLRRDCLLESPSRDSPAMRGLGSGLLSFGSKGAQAILVSMKGSTATPACEIWALRSVGGRRDSSVAGFR